jgi:RHS repeat-associated protein
MPSTSKKSKPSAVNCASFPGQRALACLLLLALFVQTVAPPAIASPRIAPLVATLASTAPGEARALLGRAASSGGTLAAAILGFFNPAMAAAVTQETWSVVLTPLTTEFKDHVGLDYHQPSRSILLSANSLTGQPNSFDTIAAGGGHAAFSNVVGLKDDLLVATARDDGQGMSLGGFRPGEVFASASAPGVIVHISSDGATVRNPWAVLPGESGMISGLHVDRTGVFGGNLLVLTSSGGVWRVPASGMATRLASLGARLAGVAAVPDDAERYGPLAGKLLAGAPEQGGLYAVDAQGQSNFVQLGVNPQDVDLIPAHENFYTVDTGSRALLGAPASAFAGIIGDILITQKSPGKLSRVRWDGTTLVVSQIGEAAELKQSAFSPAGVGQIGAAKQVYDRIAVVRHAPVLNSGRIEGALWQLTAEDITLDGKDVITSDLLVPGTPVVSASGGEFGGIIEGVESEQPTNYQVTISGNAALRHVVNRTDPVTLENVPAPPAPAGTRVVSLTKSDTGIGDAATLRDLSLSGKAGAVAVPPGTYGKFSASSHTAIVLGVANSGQPTVYNLEELTLSGGSELRLNGPVVLNVRNAVTLSGSTVGDADSPHRLLLKVAGGTTGDGVKISGSGVLYAVVRAPQRAVNIEGNGRLRGTVSCDRLTVSGNGVLQITDNDLPPPPVNRPPAVDAGADHVITLPVDTVSLNGVAGDDGLPAGSALNTTWSLVSGPGSINFSDIHSTASTATFPAPGDYVLKLTASDGQLQSSDNVSVTVVTRNQPPTVSAGADQTLELPLAAQLRGTFSDDALPHGSTIAVTWSKASGPGSVSFGDPHAAVTTASFSEHGAYTLRLTANDTELDAGDEVAIMVLPENRPPVVNAGEDQIVSLPGGINLAGSITDDGLPTTGALTSVWEQLSGPGVATIAHADQKQTAVSFSAPGTYVLKLTASDSQLSASDEITITVESANVAPSVNAGADQSITLPGNAALQGNATDDGLPRGATLNTNWSKASGPGAVTFSAAGSLAATASFSEAGTYVLRLSASDTELKGEDEVTVVVKPENRAPVVNAGVDQVITLPNVAVLNGSATDDNLPEGAALAVGWSVVSAPGAVAFSSPNASSTGVTFGAPGTYVLRFTATDSQLSTSDDLVVSANPPLNRPPVVNAGVDQSIQLPASVSLQGSVSDDGLPAGGASSVAWSKVSGPGDVTFANHALAATNAAFSAPGSYVLRLTASDSEFSISDELTITVAAAPAPPAADFTFSPGNGENIISLPGQTNVARQSSPSLEINGGEIVRYSGRDSRAGDAGSMLHYNFNRGGWIANGVENKYAVVRLAGGNIYQLTGVKVAPFIIYANPGSGVKDFEVWVSATTEDDAAFTKVLSATAASNENIQTFMFPGGTVAARYVKYVPLTGTQNIPTIGTYLFDVIAEGATGGVVGESSRSGVSRAELALDGDETTAWITQNSANQWVKLLLADRLPRRLYGVRIRPYPNLAPKNFDVRVSTTTADDAAFNTVYTGVVANNFDWQEFNFGQFADARYVQFYWRDGYSSSQIGLRDLEVLAVPDDGSALVGFSSQKSGLELGSLALDAEAGNFPWRTPTGQTTNQWLKVMLPRAELWTIGEIALLPGAQSFTNESPKDFELQISTTDAVDTSFATVFQGTLQNSQTLQTFRFQPVQARYVRLLLKNNYGAQHMSLHTFRVVSPDAGPRLARFFDGSHAASGRIVSYRWEFGDGATSSEREPQHEYAAPGNYAVALTVTDEAGLTARTEKSYRAFDPLLASFAVSPLTTNEGGESIRIRDFSSLRLGTIIRHFWNFGDNSPIFDNLSRTPGYAYSDSGTYQIALRIVGPNGGNLTATREVRVRNLPPSVTIETGKTVVWGEQWRNQPKLSDPSPADLFGYSTAWNFGDGQGDSCASCNNTNSATTHAYALPGTYTVTLTATDKDGGVSAPATTNYTVTKRPITLTVVSALRNATNDAATVRVKLQDGFDGSALGGRAVGITLNGRAANAVTDAGGFAEASLPLAAGTAPGLASADYAGEAMYESGGGVLAFAPDQSAPRSCDCDSRGRDFWIMFPQNDDPTIQDYKPAELSLYISAEQATTGTVSVPGLNFSTTFTVAARGVSAVRLPDAAQANFYGQAQGKGIRVTSDADVSIYGFSYAPFTTDGFLALPTKSLGTRYVNLAYPNTFASSAVASELGIVATDDATNVTITPSSNTGTHLAGIPFTVTLGRGQTYQLRSNPVALVPGNDLSGSQISSDKPIAVFGGNQLAVVPFDASAGNYFVEQLLPANTWGTRFAIAPLAARPNQLNYRYTDVYRFLASTDNTHIYINNALAATINRGQVYERSSDQYIYVVTDHPVLAAQYATGRTGLTFRNAEQNKPGDPSMMLVVPLDSFLSSYTISTPQATTAMPATRFHSNYVNIVVPDGSIGSVKLDGVSVASSRFTSIGTSGYSGAQLALTSGTHTLTGAQPFGANVYGFGDFDAYSYPAGICAGQPLSGNTLTLAPASSTATVGALSCVVATLTDKNGIPLTDRALNYKVEGANAKTGEVSTDAAGLAQICYAGANAGQDIISATYGTANATAGRRWLPNGPNTSPQVNAGVDQSLTLPAPARLEGSVNDDGLPQDGILTSSWSKVSGPGSVAFSTPASPATHAAFDAAGTYVLRLTASDGELSASDEVTIVVATNNLAPQVNAGTNQSITLPADAQLSGAVADDNLPAGGSLSVRWSKLSGTGEVVFAEPARASTTASFSAPGSYVLRLTASDTELTTTSDVTINVLPPLNIAPTVNAGAAQTITLPNAATLAGSASDDGLPAPGALSVAWSKMSGPGAVTYSAPNATSTSANFTEAGSYVLRLTASDGELTATSDVSVTVNPPPVNHAPAVDAGADRVATLGANLIANGGNESALDGSGEITGWIEVEGNHWTQTPAGGANFLEPRRGLNYFYAGEAAQAELRQDIDLSAFAAAIDAGTQQFIFRASVRSLVEAAPDTARVVVEYRNRTNTQTLATLDSAPISSTDGWHSTEDTRPAPPGTGWIRVRLVAARNTGATNDAYFDDISLRAVTPTAVVKLGGTATDDGEPAGGQLATTWSVGGGAPGAVTFANASSASSAATFSAPGVYVLRLTATDGALTTGDEVTVTIKAANLAPVVSAGADSGLTLPDAATLAGSYTDDGEPAGSSVSLRWSKLSGPGAVTFASASEGATTATFGAAGTYVLRLMADDGEYDAADDVTITVNPEPVNQAPTVNAGANQSIELPLDTATLSGTATDDNLPRGGALTIAWSVVGGAPGAVTFANAQQATTTATFASAGTYVLRLTASDSQLTASADVTINVRPANAAPSVNAGADQTTPLNIAAQLAGTVTDDGLPVGGQLTVTWSRVSGAGEVSFADAHAPVTPATFAEAGTYVLRLTATDGVLTASDEVTITVEAAQAPPTVQIVAPTDGADVTSPASVTGTVSDAAWKLEYSLSTGDGAQAGAQQTWTTFAAGSGARNSAPLGTLDPTMMLNGIYTLRLTATDAHGQTASESISVVVDKNLKVGNFTVSFVDMSIPLAGMPIEIVRTYDSRDKRAGDFGVGWTLGLRSMRVEKTRVIGRDWVQTRSNTFIPRYCLEATRPHIVAVTFPDNRTYKFRAFTTPQCQSGGPIGGATVSFAPMPGTHGSLAVEGSADVLVAGSVPGPVDLLGFNNQDIFNTGVFRLTTEDGTQYVVDQAGGLRSMRDTNGNTLTVSATGIHHSSGVSVAFTRDAAGRIAQVTDPTGNSVFYNYDARGDLTSFKDREAETTTYGYDAAHLLLDIKDPRGLQPMRNEYDAAGRLLSHTDAFGKKVIYAHDLAARRETVTDRLGNQTVFEYDERGNVLYSRDAEGGEKRFVYDAEDNLLSETNALGKITTYTYDAQGNRTSAKDPLGNETKYTYNSTAKLLTVTDALGRTTTTNTYDSGGNLTLTKDALNRETKYTYNAFNGQRTTTTDALGHITHYAYDSATNLTKKTDAFGHLTTYTYGALGTRKSQTTTRTLPDGTTETLTTNFEYDHEGRLTKTIYADNSTTKIEYDESGQQAATVDQLGRRTLYAYDEMGRMVKTTYPDGKKEETVYDAEGRRTKSVDRAGRETAYAYDRAGRLVKTTYPDGKFTTTAYDAAGQVASTTDALGQVTRFEYDAAGRRTKLTDALSQSTTYAYDANGNQTAVTDALLRTTHYEYDEMGRRVKTIYADGTFESVAYDELGRSVSKTDQAGKTTRFEYDKLGHLIKVTDGLNGTTTYAYDELGQQVSQTDALNHTTRYEYDKLGRRVRRTLPLGQSESYAYDAAGNLFTRTDFNGRTTTYAYDELRRLIKKTPDAAFGQQPVTYTYTDAGRRQSMTDALGTTAYAYDTRDRLLSKATPQGTLAYTYNAAGGLLSVSSNHAGGVSVNYTYDELNRLKTATDAGGATTYAYNGVGNLESYTYPNGVTSAYSYNSLNRLTSLSIGNTATSLASYTYTLGAAGNRTSVAEQSGRSVSYNYDDLYRLTAETVTNDQGGANGTASYGYDAVGNRLSRVSTLPGLTAQTLAYDENDRLTSDTSDTNGNTTASQGNAYQYDFENKLISLNGGAVQYRYDGDGNLVTKIVGGVTTSYLVDTNNQTGYAQVVEELRGGGVVRSYTYGHDLISQRQLVSGEWQTSYYGYDGHGSVRLLTDTQGAATDTYTYDAFGNLIARTGTTRNDYLYAGERFDSETGMYYLRARYMQPQTGRFWSMDSYEGRPSDPLSLHKYLYAEANPENRIDPSGNVTAMETMQVGTLVGEMAAVGMFLYLKDVQRGVEKDLGLRPKTGWREEEEANVMRVQLQEGSNHTLGDEELVRKNNSKEGVTVQQMRGALNTLYDKVYRRKEAAGWFPTSELEHQFFTAVISLSQDLNRFPPGGVMGLRRSLLSEVMHHRGKEYRIDIDNLKGWNLRK